MLGFRVLEGVDLIIANIFLGALYCNKSIKEPKALFCFNCSGPCITPGVVRPTQGLAIISPGLLGVF